MPDFWRKSNDLADHNEMDQNLAYMFLMKEESDGKILFTRQKLEEYGSRVKLFPGVEEWFERIRAYGKKQNVMVEHYYHLFWAKGDDRRHLGGQGRCV